MLKARIGTKAITRAMIVGDSAVVVMAEAERVVKRVPENHPALKDLSPADKKLVLDVMAQHPKLTVEQAVEALKEAGM